MRHRQGPTKQLAPSINPETKCPHEYIEDEGLQLEIDCSSCAGAHDLSNGKCLTGVLNVMATGAVPEAIVLRRFIHKRYRGEAIRLAATLASELASLNRAITSQEPPSDRRCRTCPVGADRVLRTLKRRLLDNPETYHAQRTAVAAELRAKAGGQTCERPMRCLETTLSSASMEVF